MNVEYDRSVPYFFIQLNIFVLVILFWTAFLLIKMYKYEIDRLKSIVIMKIVNRLIDGIKILNLFQALKLCYDKVTSLVNICIQVKRDLQSHTRCILLFIKNVRLIAISIDNAFRILSNLFSKLSTFMKRSR